MEAIRNIESISASFYLSRVSFIIQIYLWFLQQQFESQIDRESRKYYAIPD